MNTTFYMHFKDEPTGTDPQTRSKYTAEAKRDGDGDVYFNFTEHRGYHENYVSVCIRPDMAVALRDRLNVLFPVLAEAELAQPSVPIHEEANETNV